MPASDDETTVAPLHEGMRKPNLTSQQRRDIAQALLLMVVPCDVELKLMLGAIKSVSETFHVDRKIIRKIWRPALANFNNPALKSLTFSQKKKEIPVILNRVFVKTFVMLFCSFPSIRGGPSYRLHWRWRFRSLRCLG